jgi:DNA-binding MarR family transcriptional regulator/GNAT superfamily N-acetyltransferase
VTEVDVVRRFNRVYTPRIGVLDDSFLGSGMPLGAARLLFEIGPSGAVVRDLRSRLGLDSGYFSRLLRRLEHDGLVVVAQDPSDRRRRTCRLTGRGRRRWQRLDERSDHVAEALLAPLSPSQRTRLVEALDTAALLVGAASIRFETVDPTGGDATAAMSMYFAELDARFDDGFDPSAGGQGAVAMRAPDGAFLLARDAEGALAGCGGLQRHDATTAEVKRMWIAPAWRGAGVGRRLLEALEVRAGEIGYRSLVLDTNETLTEAIALYGAAGFRPTERYNDNPHATHFFRKDLAEAG